MPILVLAAKISQIKKTQDPYYSEASLSDAGSAKIIITGQ